MEGDEFVTALIPLKEFRDDRYLFMVTRQGTVKKGVLSDYDAVRKDGLIAIRLRPDDELIGVRLTEGNCDIMLVTKNGKSLCFNERDVRSMGRTAYGVLGIRLDSGDEVVGMERLGQADQVLVVTEKGYGKRTELKEYRLQKRGGKGIITLRVTERNGHLVSTKVVDERDEVLLMSSDDIIIRIPVKEVTLQGRNTQGVRPVSYTHLAWIDQITIKTVIGFDGLHCGAKPLRDLSLIHI